MKILAISYSQTGQLDDILGNILSPLSDLDIDRILIKPKKAYPFPWTASEFFDAMPETVLEEPIELYDIKFKHDFYDLIILGYQPWFLSPSLPISTLLQLAYFKRIVSETPVITIIGSRNMWINSQKSINMHIVGAGGRIIGNIPFIDKNPNLISAITILYWMLKGRKDNMLKIFPKPGVSEDDINGAKKIGLILRNNIFNNTLDDFQNQVISSGYIKISTSILFIESRAKKIFLLWARIIKKQGLNKQKRFLLVYAFIYYLIFALFVVAPIVLMVYHILILPFTLNKINKKKYYICQNKL